MTHDPNRSYFALGDASGNRIRGLAMPYSVSNGRRGGTYVVENEGEWPKFVEYAGSIYEPGVFSRWLSEGGASRVRFLFQHGDAGQGFTDSPTGQNSLPLGVITSLTEDETGLHFEAEFASHPLARAVKELVSMGGLTELSVCTAPVTAELRRGDDGEIYRHVSDAELYDASVVVWGQYGPGAPITELFSHIPAPARDERIAEVARGALAAATAIGPVVERYVGASISLANAEPLLAAVTDMRSAASNLTEHADAIDALVSAGVSGKRDEAEAVDETDTAAANEARELHASLMARTVVFIK